MTSCLKLYGNLLDAAISNGSGTPNEQCTQTVMDDVIALYNNKARCNTEEDGRWTLEQYVKGIPSDGYLVDPYTMQNYCREKHKIDLSTETVNPIIPVSTTSLATSTIASTTRVKTPSTTSPVSHVSYNADKISSITIAASVSVGVVIFGCTGLFIYCRLRRLKKMRAAYTTDYQFQAQVPIVTASVYTASDYSEHQFSTQNPNKASSTEMLSPITASEARSGSMDQDHSSVHHTTFGVGTQRTDTLQSVISKS